jgi:hypothetical protein
MAFQTNTFCRPRMEAAGFFETSVSVKDITCNYTAEDCVDICLNLHVRNIPVFMELAVI